VEVGKDPELHLEAFFGALVIIMLSFTTASRRFRNPCAALYETPILLPRIRGASRLGVTDCSKSPIRIFLNESFRPLKTVSVVAENSFRHSEREHLKRRRRIA
jgi:hypothetical protein